MLASQVALVGKNPPANAGERRYAGLIPRFGKYPGVGHSNPFQYDQHVRAERAFPAAAFPSRAPADGTGLSHGT